MNKIQLITFISLAALLVFIQADQTKNASVASSLNETILAENQTDFSSVVKANEKETISLKCPIDLKKDKTIQADSNESDGDNYDDEDIEDYDSASFEDDKQEDLSRTKRSDDSYLVVQWYKDSAKLNRFSPRFEQDGLKLKIKNIQFKDSGKYKCRLINGFGSFSYEINLQVNRANNSVESIPNAKTTRQTQKFKSPVFINTERMQSRYFHKQKGSQVRFNCRASGLPKPDILWFKNGKVLSEEEYGITRSKWTLDLKDLRMDDNGNFTCQVFNKYGYINATFELIVYEDSQIFEGLDPLNATITAGMDAVFNCKVKSTSVPNIKWMKQITRAEYTNYVIQNSNNENLLMSEENSNEKESDEFKSLYVLSTLPSLKVIEKNANKNFDDSSLNDLLGSDYNLNSNSKQDDFNFELFVPSELNENKLSKKQSFKKSETKDDSGNRDEDSVHYITLSSSPSILEKFSYNKEKNYYVSQLVIKQASVKDTGVYVCFGASTKGYSYRKSYLKVIPTMRAIQPSIFYPQSYYKIKELETIKTNHLFNKPAPSVYSSTQAPISFSSAVQSIGYFIVIIPVLLISCFAIISVCYLKRLDNQKEITNENSSSLVGFFKSFFSNSSNKSNKKNGLFCCPSNLTHVLIQNNYDDVIDKKQDPFPKNTLSTSGSSEHTNTLKCATTSLGSSMSDSSSTSATTVAYYATIPLLLENNVPSSPPPLPNSQPPTFSPVFTNPKSNTINQNYNRSIEEVNLPRAESTPSMAYYKIVDNELENCKLPQHENDRQVVSNEYKLDGDTTTCSSRFYYQLAPNGNINYNCNSNRNQTTTTFQNVYQKNF